MGTGMKSRRRRTTSAGEAEDLMRTPLQEFVSEVGAARGRVNVGRVLRLDEIVEAHRVMEKNRAAGKFSLRLASRVLPRAAAAGILGSTTVMP